MKNKYFVKHLRPSGYIAEISGNTVLCYTQKTWIHTFLTSQANQKLTFSFSKLLINYMY